MGFAIFVGKEIGFERLEVYPTAKLCIQCQKERQLNIKDLEHDRPIEEEVLELPFGRTFTDGRDNAAYDGEDAWQDVQQYGSSSGPQDISVNRLIKYNNAYYDSDENPGIADKMDRIDQEDYKEQLPDD
jgi:Prokaryotic dksA/traR C4-type zinc finger.